MDLIKALQPFDAALKLFESRGALPQADVKDALIKIYEDLHKVKPNVGPAKISPGCGSCVKDMMKSLVNNRREWVNRPLVDFKGIKETSKANVETKKVADKTLEQLELLKLNPDEMKFPALKITAAKYKIPFTPSTNKVELVALVKNYIERNK
jgi:hypothetical protein